MLDSIPIVRSQTCIEIEQKSVVLQEEQISINNNL